MAICPTCEQDVGDALFCPHDATPLSHLGHARASMPRPGDSVDGRYELIETLGRGGMAVVFRAASSALGRDVALKVLYPRWAEDEKTVARFAREARAASQIDHEGVVRVYDFGFAQEGFYFLTMELLEGQPLSELDIPLRTGRAMRLLKAIASGLARAHELGVIHRDLKPENIMVWSEGGRERIKIVDFGLSKIDEGAMLTGEGDVIGTPDFMAPEQWQGKAVDTRADVYAFGILAYWMLSGELPYQGDSLIQLLQQHLYADPVPLAEQRNVRMLPAALGDFVMRCMSKDALDRPPHMGRVHAELVRIDEASRELSMSPTRVGLGPAPLTTVVSLEDGMLLDALELRREIARLRQVRRKRLSELVPKVYPQAAPPLILHMQGQIRAAEETVEAAEQDLALAEAVLIEAQRAHRYRDAELRARLVNANLELAVARHALPTEVTKEVVNPSHGETINIAAPEPESSWPPTDVSADGDLARARLMLRRAEERLAGFVRTPDESIARAEHLFDTALGIKDGLEPPLEAVYAQLEAALRAAPGADDGPLEDLDAIDGVVGAYRSRLAILDRHARRDAG